MSTSPGERVDDVFQSDASEDAIAERLDDLAGLFELLDADTVQGSAIDLADDRVLCDVDEAAREIAGVGRLECRIGETLTARHASR